MNKRTMLSFGQPNRKDGIGIDILSDDFFANITIIITEVEDEEEKESTLTLTREEIGALIKALEFSI